MIEQRISAPDLPKESRRTVDDSPPAGGEMSRHPRRFIGAAERWARAPSIDFAYLGACFGQPILPDPRRRGAAARPLPTSTLSTVLHFYFAPHTVDSSSARVPFSIEDAPQPSRGFTRKGPL